MKIRILGSTGMKVSVVGVGTWQFGGEWGRSYEQNEADAIFAAARDCGINLIDTAECYGNHTSERFIGKSIEGDRDQWIVATKFGSNDVRGKWHSDEDRERQLAEVEKIRRDEVPEGVNMAAWALAWCLRDPVVTAVIPGCKDASQVKSNAAAVDLL